MTAAAATDTPAPTQTIEPVGTDLTDPLPAVDTTRGEQLFSTKLGTYTCADCHAVAEGEVIQGGGPSLYDIADRAATTIEGYSAEKYLRESILLPCEYLAHEGSHCPMPREYGERIDAQDLADLIAFLMDQTAQP